MWENFLKYEVSNFNKYKQKLSFMTFPVKN